jgi:hypothetical protein
LSIMPSSTSEIARIEEAKFLENIERDECK